MPFERSGVASAPDRRHGLPSSPVTGIKKGRSSDRPFSFAAHARRALRRRKRAGRAAWTSNQSCHRN
ncbi:hypothetical protein B0909_24570 [Rhizobium rhizogenes]|nr:hypothetical protein B0909_24570 [Rhizobium rhizogenes]